MAGTILGYTVILQDSQCEGWPHNVRCPKKVEGAWSWGDAKPGKRKMWLALCVECGHRDNAILEKMYPEEEPPVFKPLGWRTAINNGNSYALMGADYGVGL